MDGIGRIGIVGVGRAGSALGAALLASGHDIAAVTARSAGSRERAARLLPDVAVLPIDEVVTAVDVLLLGVPDDAIEAVTRQMAPRLRAGQFVVHLSGAHGLAALQAATERGAVPVALHPPMTFTATALDVERIPGVTFTATAPDAARPLVERLVEELGSGVQWIAEGQRAAYHAGLVHGANHLVTLLAQASEVLAGAGIADPSATLGPLMTAMLDNALRSGHDALTGPIARGDVETVRAHLAALTGDVLASYVVLARSTVDRVAADGRIDRDTAATLRQLLGTVDSVVLDREGQR
jgi:predicted short-subunit dehydrogenase-like oxidoreductase (DUF2520 family)